MAPLLRYWLCNPRLWDAWRRRPAGGDQAQDGPNPDPCPNRDTHVGE